MFWSSRLSRLIHTAALPGLAPCLHALFRQFWPGQLWVPVWTDNHWALFVLGCQDQMLHCRLHDGIPGRCTQVLTMLTEAFSRALELPVGEMSEVCLWHQHDNQSCGAYVLAHAAALLSGRSDFAFIFIHWTSCMVCLPYWPPSQALAGSLPSNTPRWPLSCRNEVCPRRSSKIAFNRLSSNWAQRLSA